MATLVLVMIALMLASCADAETPASTMPSNSTATTTSPSGSWSTFEATIESAAEPSPETSPPEVHLVIAVDDGYLAAGTSNGGLAVWSSDDLVDFALRYTEPCCVRYLSVTSIVQHGDQLLLSASGEARAEDGTRTERSWLLVSDDDGASWVEVDDPAFGGERQYLHPLIVADDAVIAAVTVGDDLGDRSTETWRSTDLLEWTRVAIPGLETQEAPLLLAGDTIVWVVQKRSGGRGVAAWRSDDAGATFEQLPPLDDQLYSAAVVDDTLVVWPTVFPDDGVRSVETGPWVINPGGSWNRLRSDTGQWGDSRIRMWDGVDPATGRLIAVVTRVQRSDPHYCFADPQTCNQGEIAVVTSTDGIEWFDLEGANLEIDNANAWHVLPSDGGIAIVHIGRSEQGPFVRVRRWSGPGLPPIVDPVSSPPPDRPVPMYDGGAFPIGDEKRIELGLGGCGGMYVDEISWVPTEPLPEPLPDSWPFRAVEIADGPTGYLYARITRIATDRIELSIEGEGTVATYVPRDPDSERAMCG